LSFVTLRSANEQLWLLTFAEVTRRHNEIVRDLPPEARSRDSDREGSGRQHARGSRGGASSSHEIEERVQSRTRRGRPRASRGAKEHGITWVPLEHHDLATSLGMRAR